MSTKPQIELFLENESGTQQVAYPFVESDHVSLSNGMDIDTMIRQDVSMPTVAHEDLSFKAGVGDQDVSSAIVDSSVAEMTIKGKTYQNILPEPSTHVLTNNKEMFKVNEGLDPNVEIVDGVSKSAILSGQTLVNIRGKAVNTQADFIDYEVYGLQNNTTYTIVVESTDTNAISVVGFLKDTGKWNCETTPRTQNCKVVLTTTSAELMGRVRVRKDNKQDTSQAIQIRVMVLEGDYSNVDIPHFEGMTSCKMPVLCTTGKNLFDGKFEFGEIAGGANDKQTKYVKSTSYISIKPNTNYFLSCTDGYNSTGGRVIAWYDSNRNFISHVNNKGVSPSNAYFARIRTRRDDSAAMTGNEISTIQAQFEESSSATSYEPHKTNILHTPEEVVLRSLPNGVCDTLNLNTGEYVQRIGEKTFNGSDDEKWTIAPSDGGESCTFLQTSSLLSSVRTGNSPLHCDRFTWKNALIQNTEFIKVGSGEANGHVYINILNSKLSSQDATGFNQWLQSNPVTVQYELATPIVKTVDLSSSGNWEKIVLNGSENWSKFNTADLTTTSQFYLQLPNFKSGVIICNEFPYYPSRIVQNGVEGVSGSGGNGLNIWLNILNSKIGGNTVEKFKQYLSQNPLTVWYQTTTHQDSTQVKQPIFFKDGHIQLSSGVDNSLIPTLDYQAKTSNSYVMDLMKTNTKYTMKAKSASGTFTIDGTSYGAGTNGTFTTPSSMTNKFLVMSNKTNEEVMILEGDVTDKTIPYFKGIKSAFENKDKIEVLSCGKNLIKKEEFKEYILKYHPQSTFYVEDGVEYCKTRNHAFHKQPFMKGQFKKGTRYTMTLKAELKQEKKGLHLAFRYTDDTYSSDYTSSTNPTVLTVTSSKDKVVDYVYLSYGNGGDVVLDLDSFQLTETDSRVEYEPYKSNSTKIPLLSSLKNVPNGVYDEVILDRENNKAKIIQRVGKVVLDGSESWGSYANREHYFAMSTRLPNCRGGWDTCYSRCDKVIYNTGVTYDKSGKAYTLGAENDSPSSLYLCLPKSELSTPDSLGFKQWLKENQPTVLYRLETPVITEVDLEGFPYIYKDGHIFLNGDITPVTEIKYSINQQHQIEASNQDIIRHQKEIDYLYKLIGEYVRVDYKNTLLSLNLELK